MSPFRATSRRSVVLQIFALTAVLAGLIVTATAQSGKRLAALANPFVNAADSTEHDTQDTAAVLKVPGTSIVIAAYRDTSVYNLNAHKTGWSRSTDNGATWTSGGMLPNSALGDEGSPVLARDNTSGTIYLVTQAFIQSGVQLFRSTDNGASWLAPVNAFSNFTGGDVLVTPWIAVDNFAGTGQGYVYIIARNVAGGGGGSQASGQYVRRSTDGGATFGSQVMMTTLLWTGPAVAVGTDHTLMAFGWANLTPKQIRMRRSTDFGVTFGGFITAASLNGTSTTGDLGLNGGFKTNSSPRMIIDTASGDVNLFYNDKNGADKADIYVVSSADQGANWDPPELLVHEATGRDQFFPSVAQTPNGRNILLSWYDRRSDPANLAIERWGIVATKSLITSECCSLSPHFRISTGSWPVVIGQDSFILDPVDMGSYDQTGVDNTGFYLAWADNRIANPASTPLPHANQPDIRFAKILLNGPPRGDLDRDLQTDRTVYRPSSGAWYSALSSGGANTAVWGVSTDIDVQGDYDGDAKSDLAVFRPSTGQWFIVKSSTGDVSIVQWGSSGDIPLAGDVDGDGSDDLVIYRPSAGAWYVLFSSGGFYTLGWGTNGDIPLLGDYVDGNGAEDLVIFRPSSGTWYAFSPWNDEYTVVGWGTNGDIPVVGDFDGDLLSDPAVFRPSTGQWWISKSTGGTLTTQWGISTDTPVSGDFDGDGKTDISIWRDSNGGWYSLLSSGGSASVAWGVSGDKPSGRRPGS